MIRLKIFFKLNKNECCIFLKKKRKKKLDTEVY